MRLFLMACITILHIEAYTQVTSRETLFQGVTIVDVESGGLLPDRDVLVRNGQIASIRKHRQAASGLRKEQLLIKAKGKYMLPGLADCHTHIIYHNDLLHYLRNGVTSVFSLGQPKRVLQFREEINQGILPGPTIYAAALIDTVPQDWEDTVYSFVVHSPVEVDSVFKLIREQGYDLIKVYNSLTTAEFDEVMRQSGLYTMPVVGHGVREPGMEHILSKGMAMVAHGEEYLYTVFRDSLDERKIPSAVAFTRKYGAFVCPNLSTFHTIMTQWGDSTKFARLLQEAGQVKQRVSPKMLDFWLNHNRYIHREGSPLVPMFAFLQKFIAALYKAGVPLVAGTDSPIIPGTFPGYSMVTELQLLTGIGMRNHEALQTATLVPGQFISRYLPSAPKTGIIRQGYSADILLLSANPLENIRNLRNISGVMVKGAWYTRDHLDELIKR